MKKHYFIGLLLLTAQLVSAQYNSTLSQNEIKETSLIYDRATLRVPNSSFAFGLGLALKNGEYAKTVGFLNGKVWWRNFKIDVDGGYYFLRKIYVSNSTKYSKGQNVNVKVYLRKNDSLIIEKNIPLNYETKVEIVAPENFIKAPGRHIKLGLRTIYDNGEYEEFDKKYTKKKLAQRYIITSEGGEFKKGGMRITSNVDAINKHTVWCMAKLKINPSISDTFSVQLDYIDRFNYHSVGAEYISGFNASDGSDGAEGQCGMNGAHGEHGRDGGHGHDLDVLVDVYFDEILAADLLKIKVLDLHSGAVHKYLVNPNGGSINIVSSGGLGSNGSNGGNGGNGGNGAAGKRWEEEQKINDSTYVMVEHIGKGKKGKKGGDAGSGGNGGFGGDGGNVIIYYTAGAEAFLPLVKGASRHGQGGYGGRAGRSGSGGSGGNGEPNGKDGCSGRPGYSGADGSGGRRGFVMYKLLEKW